MSTTLAPYDLKNKNLLVDNPFFTHAQVQHFLTTFERRLEYGDLRAFTELFNKVIISHNINEKTHSGRTLLTYSAYLDNEELTQHLLSLGADPLAKDNVNFNPLRASYGFSQLSPKSCALLITAAYQKMIAEAPRDPITSQISSKAVQEIKELFAQIKKEITQFPHYDKAQVVLVQCEEHLRLSTDISSPTPSLSSTNSKFHKI